MNKFLDAYRWFKDRLGIKFTIDEVREYNIPITEIYSEIISSKGISRESLLFLKQSGLMYFLKRNNIRINLRKPFFGDKTITNHYSIRCKPLKIRELLLRYKDK